MLPQVARKVIRSVRQFRHEYHYSSARRFVLRQFRDLKVGAEIGVRKGDFSQDILNHVNPVKLYLIDPWCYQPAPEFERAFYGGMIGSQEAMDRLYASVRDRFSTEVSEKHVEIIRKTSGDAVQCLPNQSLDFLYVDGDHRRDGALADLVNYYEKIKPGAVVAGDDYADVGMWWKDGVIRAVEQAIHMGLYCDLAVRYNQFLMYRV